MSEEDSVLPVVEPSHESTALLGQFQEAASSGRSLIAEAKGREAQRWAPLVVHGRLPSEHVEVLEHDPDSPTQADVLLAQRASLGIGLESATQVMEFRHQGRQVRDDAASLQKLGGGLKGVNEVRLALIERDPGFVIEEMRKVMDRRGDGNSSEMADEKVLQQSERVLSKAYGRLVKLARPVDDYNRMRY